MVKTGKGENKQKRQHSGAWIASRETTTTTTTTQQQQQNTTTTRQKQRRVGIETSQ